MLSLIFACYLDQVPRKTVKSRKRNPDLTKMHVQFFGYNAIFFWFDAFSMRKHL